MTIQIDSREKPKAIRNICYEFTRQGAQYFINKLPCGDYCSLDNARFCIDRKQNLNELVNNVCQQHQRFINELKRANELGIKLVFLVEHGGEIRTLEDVRRWVNPRLRESPLAVSGERLYKILSTLEARYNTKFYFCTKAQTGKEIIRILKEGTKMNNVSLIGRLTADPELKTTQSGINTVRFSIAVDRQYAKQGEERQADFINIVAWRQTAEFICRYFSKGQRIALTGRIQTGSYTDRDGNKRYSFDVLAENVEFCEKKNSGSDGNSSRPAVQTLPDDVDKIVELPSDDDLPF